jgi:hypothetical protein
MTLVQRGLHSITARNCKQRGSVLIINHRNTVKRCRNITVGQLQSISVKMADEASAWRAKRGRKQENTEHTVVPYVTLWNTGFQ